MTEKYLTEYNTALHPDYICSLKSKGFSKKNMLAAAVLYVPVYAVLLTAFLLIGAAGLQLTGNAELLAQSLKSNILTDMPFSDKLWDIILFLLFPAGIITNKIVFKTAAGSLMSVFGKFRISWFLICFVLMLPIAAFTVVGQILLDGIPDFTFSRATLSAIMLTLLLTPLQCAGEEMLFRGWSLQVFGIAFGNKKTAWAALSLILSFLFSIVHSPANMWVGIELFVFGILMCGLIYITGGIEASIVFHSATNLFLGIITDITAGQMTFEASDTEAAYSWEGTVLSICTDIFMFAAVTVLWKKLQKRALSEKRSASA